MSERKVRTPDMTQPHYLIAMGRPGAGGAEAYYYIEHASGPVLPLFSTPQKARRYIMRTLNTPAAHIDMLEGVDPHAPTAETVLGNLREGRFGIVRCETEGLAVAMLEVGTRSIVLDLRLGGPRDNPILTLGA